MKRAQDILASFERHGEQLQLMALRLYGQRADAEDALQWLALELLIKDTRQPPSRSYLQKRLRGRFLDRCRTKHRRDKLLERYAAQLVPFQRPIESAPSMVDGLLRRLTDEERFVFLCRAVWDLPNSEVAAELGIAEATATRRYQTARKRLQGLIARQETELEEVCQ